MKGTLHVERAGKYLGLNAHYRNYWQVPIQIKVWSSMHPYQGTPVHLAQTIIDYTDMFSINVPPNTQRIQPGRWDNTGAVPYQVYSVTGHMHQRGLRFTAWRSNGTKIYENFDFAHPIFRQFVPPLVIPPGDWIDYECLHDNGVTRPVKRDANGNPTTLLFGVTTDDEMCTKYGTPCCAIAARMCSDAVTLLATKGPRSRPPICAWFSTTASAPLKASLQAPG